MNKLKQFIRDFKLARQINSGGYSGIIANFDVREMHILNMSNTLIMNTKLEPSNTSKPIMVVEWKND